MKGSRSINTDVLEQQATKIIKSTEEKIMTDLDHRVGVRENSLVVRNLRLSNVKDENIDPLIEYIDQMFGLDEVSFNRKEETIHLAYDAVNLNLPFSAQHYLNLLVAKLM